MPDEFVFGVDMIARVKGKVKPIYAYVDRRKGKDAFASGRWRKLVSSSVCQSIKLFQSPSFSPTKPAFILIDGRVGLCLGLASTLQSVLQPVSIWSSVSLCINRVFQRVCYRGQDKTIARDADLQKKPYSFPDSSSNDSCRAIIDWSHIVNETDSWLFIGIFIL